jgi:hypothetical protein
MLQNKCKGLFYGAFLNDGFYLQQEDLPPQQPDFFSPLP